MKRLAMNLCLADHHNTSEIRICHLISPGPGTHHTTRAVHCKEMHLRLYLHLSTMQCLTSPLSEISPIPQLKYPSEAPPSGGAKGKCLFFKFVREMSQAECWANQWPGMARPGLTGDWCYAGIFHHTNVYLSESQILQIHFPP